MVSLLSEEQIEVETEIVGFVFPVHCTTLPVPVRQFFAKLTFRSQPYLFAVSTQGGAPPRLVEFHLADIIQAKGQRLNAFFSIKMPWSSPVGLMPVYIPGFIEYPKPPQKIARMQAVARQKLDVIQKVVQAQEDRPQDDFPRAINLFVKRLICRLMGSMTTGLEENQIDFFADSDCTGCGLCEEVCLSQRIEMIEGKPVWQEEVQCYFCYACFSFCPRQSVMVRKVYTKKRERYYHPDITPHQIASQKK